MEVAMKSNQFRIIVVALFALSIACGGQSAQTKPANKPPAEVEAQLKKLEEAKAKGRALEAELKSLPTAELAKRLEADSKTDVEPFNSVAFREARGRGAQAGAELAGYVKNPDRSSFLTLMAVYTTNKDAYNRLDVKLRAAILTEALRTSKEFNSWGLPHLYWEDAAKALIGTGEAAEQGLRALLKENREAPVWGSEEASESQRYKYRVKDYAWALLMEIRGKRTEIPVEPENRDRMIAELGG
jgi:hypothetical protein